MKNPENLKDVDKVQNYLNEMEAVTSTISIIDIVKQLHKTIMDDDQKYYTIPDTLQKIHNLFALYEMNEEAKEDLSSLINLGASPRATIFLARASKAQAFLNKRGYVIPDDVRKVGKAILRHRIIITYEAEAEEITTEYIIKRIYESVATP